MAGGTWTAQNKTLPGVYINYKSAPTTLATMGERGTVAIAEVLNWGSDGFTIIESPNDCSKLGYDSNAEQMTFVREILRGTNRTSGANKILVWRLATTSSVKAEVEIGNLTATAKYAGVRGNDISIVVTKDIDNEHKFYVQTLVEGSTVDSITVESASSVPTVEELLAVKSANDWVVFSGSGSLSESAGAPLTDGANGSLSTTAYSDFLSALESQHFDVVIYDGATSTMKAAFANFTKRLSNDLGIKCISVVYSYSADNETCISVNTMLSYTTDDGVVRSPETLTWRVGGATAGAKANESLTNASFPGITSIKPELSVSQQESAIKDGQFALISQFGSVRCLYDINTFVSFLPEKGKAFSKNRTIRTVFGVCNDIYSLYSRIYIGAVSNNKDGRTALKAEIISLLTSYEGIGALQNVVADDVTVERGTESDAVIIEISLQPVDSIEKIYVNITIS